MKYILVGLLIANAFILLLGWRYNYVKNKTTKGNTNHSEPCGANTYDSTGRHISSAVELLAEKDSDFIRKIKSQVNSEAELDRIRKGVGKNSRKRYRG